MSLKSKFSNVLVVDDSPLDRFITEKLLSSTGFAEKITSVPSGIDALECLSKKDMDTPQLIFLDINMPVMSGFDVLDKISGESHKNLVVVMLTSSIVDKDQEKARHYPLVRSFVIKPLTREKIQQLQAYLV